MRILIIGAGHAGQQLALRLCQDQNDVVVVDRDRAALDQLDASLDVMTLVGEGSNPSVLEEAGIDQTDLVVALTSSDESNIVSCLLANAAGVATKVARINEADFLRKHGDLFDLRKLGIDQFVSQQDECAIELYDMLRMPGAQEVINLMEGRILCAGIKLPTDSPLLRSTLEDFEHPEKLATIRFLAYRHGKEVDIPSGKTRFSIGDDVYVCGEPHAVEAFLSYAMPEEHSFSRIVVAGGGRLGLRLSQRLEEAGMKTVLIEQDVEVAEFCSDHLKSSLVIRGNCLEQETLFNLGINDDTAFVAVTGNDENNVMSCLVAEKMGAHFTAAKVNNPDYVPIINSLSLMDRAVSSHQALINAIYHFVRGRNIHADALLQKVSGELMDFYMGPEHPWHDVYIRDVKMPEGSIVGMVSRQDKVMVATGDLRLQTNDHLVVFAREKAVKKLQQFFA